MLSTVSPAAPQLDTLRFAQSLPVAAPRFGFANAAPEATQNDRFQAAPATKKSLLALTPIQQQFLDGIEQVKAGLPEGMSSEEYVRYLEREHRIPTEVYQAVVKAGLTVVGVPMPTRQQLQAGLAEDTDLVNEIANLKGQDVIDQATANSASLAPRLIDQSGKGGHAALQAISAVALAKEMSVGVATALGVNSGLAGEAIAKTGTDAQKAIWLNMMQDGLATFAYGLTEEKTGSDPRSIKTTWKENPDGSFTLKGDKKFIGGMADVTDKDGNVVQKGNDFMVTFAVDDPGKPPEEREFRAFVVPREAILANGSIERTGSPDGKTGLNEVNNATLKLDNVQVPRAFMLGEGSNIYPFLLKSLDETRLFVGAMSLGTTEATLETIQQYIKERVQNGHPIGEFQAVAFPLRENAADAEAAKLLIANTAQKVDQILESGEKSEKFRTDTAMSKLFCSELARRTTENAVQAMGGNGFLEDANGRGIPKRMRDAKVLTIYEGTTNIQRNLITGGVLITEGKALIKTAKAKAVTATLTRHPGQLLGRLIQGKSPVRTIATSLLEQKRSQGASDMKNALGKDPLDVIEAAYQSAEKELKDAWKTGGVPAKYDGWDDKSIAREQSMEALNPVQARMHLMAEIAVDRHLAALVTDELSVLADQPKLSPADAERRDLLNQFLKQAKKRSIDRYNELRGDSLENLEADHTRQLAATTGD